MSASSVDTAGFMEFSYSPRRMIRLVALGVVMIGASVFAISPELFGLEDADSHVFIGVIGVIFFGGATAFAIWRLGTASRPVLTLGPAGVRDFRIAGEFIPWTGITKISEGEVKKQKFIILSLRDETEKQLTLTNLVKWSRGPNRLLGFDGVCVTAQGLAIRHGELLDAFRAHAAANSVILS